MVPAACPGDLTSAAGSRSRPNRLRFPRAKPNLTSRTCAAQALAPRRPLPSSHSSPLLPTGTVGSTTPTLWKPCSRRVRARKQLPDPPPPKKCRGTAPAHAPLYSCRAPAAEYSLILEGGGGRGRGRGRPGWPCPRRLPADPLPGLRRPSSSAAAAALSGRVWEEWLRSWWVLILRWGFRRNSQALRPGGSGARRFCRAHGSSSCLVVVVLNFGEKKLPSFLCLQKGMVFSDDGKMKGCQPNLFRTKDKKVAKRADRAGCSTAKCGSNNSKSPSSSPFRKLSEVRSIRLSHFLSHSSNATKYEHVRIFVSTWNVGGKAPTAELKLDDFLPADDHSDIYVLGFQEIVPLNAGNVLVIEDNEPAARWLALINRALNQPVDTDADIFQHKPSPSLDPTSSQSTPGLDGSFSNRSRTASGSIIFQKSLKSIKKSYMPSQRKQLKFCNCPVEMAKKSYKDACFRCPQAYANEMDSSEEDELDDKLNDIFGLSDDGVTSATTASRDQLKYNLISCKQMVGIFVMVWAKKELVQHIGHLRTSCVGRGIMGYLGNKGCISVSMTMYQTSFCFICSHLASGEKEGDELRRNLDVLEILRLTQFRRICRRAGRRIPEKILDHERVIWLGDLNYRISLSYEDTKKLLTENNWDALFEKDQLNIQRASGRVFKGWSEEKIYFAPTYKYSCNSDSYAGETVTSKKKRRTPAWCDRILWHGDGIAQLSYFRGESQFSDHRPVCGTFIVDAERLDGKSKRRSSNTNIRIGAEELLPSSNKHN